MAINYNNIKQLKCNTSVELVRIRLYINCKGNDDASARQPREGYCASSAMPGDACISAQRGSVWTDRDVEKSELYPCLVYQNLSERSRRFPSRVYSPGPNQECLSICWPVYTSAVPFQRKESMLDILVCMFDTHKTMCPSKQLSATHFGMWTWARVLIILVPSIFLVLRHRSQAHPPPYTRKCRIEPSWDVMTNALKGGRDYHHQYSPSLGVYCHRHRDGFTLNNECLNLSKNTRQIRTTLGTISDSMCSSLGGSSVNIKIIKICNSGCC